MRFRGDLYYRLSVFSIDLPPLRERADDLETLVQHCLKRFNRELGREVVAVAPQTLERLRAYSWPGNVRELQSVLKRAFLRASGNVLLPNFLPDLTEHGERAPLPQRPAFDLNLYIRERLASGAADIHSETHAEVDRMLFTRALEFTQGNHRDAARVIGISRQTLRIKMRALGIHVAHSVEPDDEA